MHDRFTRQILEHLRHPNYAPSPVKQIAKEMRIDPEDRDAFDAAVERLISEGKLLKGKKDDILLPSYGDEVEGRLKLNPRGFGFIIPDDYYREGHLFIPPGRTNNAISGDRVRATVSRRRNRAGKNDVVGDIVEILERGRSRFTGELYEQDGQWFVEPDGKLLHDPVVIRDPHAKNAKAGDKVVIELLHYPDHEHFGEGVITELLGAAGAPDVETEAVIIAHGLHTVFSEEALEQARNASAQFDEDVAKLTNEREDLRDRFVFTIDPPDAKDFDDAICIAFSEDSGEWELGVHIADVAHFVKKDSPLDRDAMERGNSVYLPRRVLPMLPEVLSNGVCSLQEGVDRFTKSVFIRFDSRGRVISQRMANTIINSRKRMTYLEAQGLIDGDQKTARKHSRTSPAYTDEMVEKLQLSDRLAKILRKRRIRDGMITLNLPEIELVFDDNGHVIDAVPEDDAFTHTIIEMFMVEANEALARAFEDLGVPVLRRIHPEPSFGDMEELRIFAALAQVRLPEEPDRQDLQRLLEVSRSSPAGRAIHFAVLRTLTKATYSPAIIGHYALASDHYAHYTSPIRRYPDLSLHRVMQAYLELTENGKASFGGKKRATLGRRILADTRVLDEEALVTLGTHCSDTEESATDAERELRNLLVMQFLAEHHMGDEFEAIVTGTVSRGVFVSIERFLVEGLVRLNDMPGSKDRADKWTLNEGTHRLTAARSGMTIGIGDRVTVQIAAVDLSGRQLDLLITKFPEAPAPGLPRKRGQGHGDKQTKHSGKGKSKSRGHTKSRAKGAKKGRG